MEIFKQQHSEEVQRFETIINEMKENQKVNAAKEAKYKKIIDKQREQISELEKSGANSELLMQLIKSQGEFMSSLVASQKNTNENLANYLMELANRPPVVNKLMKEK